MRRAFYRFLLALHPASFQRQFSGEMLWVFDEAARDGQSAGFCADVAGSLVRQWARKPMLWSIVGALIGPVAAIFGMSAMRAHPSFGSRHTHVQLDDLLYLASGSMLAICLTLSMTVALFHSLRRRRL